MLKRFEVTNYKNFKDTFILDFSDVREYKFNADCIKNDLINNAIIYGKNAKGKTNLGYALLDIRHTIWDDSIYYRTSNKDYLNADSDKDYAEFKYTFDFNGKIVKYEYKKSDSKTIIEETLSIDEQLIYFYKPSGILKIEGNLNLIHAETLNWEFNSEEISALRYIINNTPQPDDSIIRNLAYFTKRMFMVRPEMYNKNIYEIAINEIIEKNLIKEYEDFLNDNDIECNLEKKSSMTGEDKLYFKHINSIPLIENSSSGTIALTVYYYYYHFYNEIQNKSNLFIYFDEFDAFYHYELSEKIIRMMINKQNCQSVFTTHNTNLLSNSIMRPDCFFIITDNRITNLASATDRELREGHNLEKLYKSGEFDA